MNTDFRRNRHAVFNLKYHLVVVTKYRHKYITEEMLKELENIARRLFSQKDCEVLEFNGETDHIHILFEAVPHVELAKLINTFKTVSSRLIRKYYGEYLKQFYWENVFWSRSYCILTTGGATIDTIRKYIQSQGKKPNSSPPKSKI